jgi:hypothetical protein
MSTMSCLEFESSFSGLKSLEQESSGQIFFQTPFIQDCVTPALASSTLPLTLILVRCDQLVRAPHSHATTVHGDCKITVPFSHGFFPLNRVIAKTRKVRSCIMRDACTDKPITYENESCVCMAFLTSNEILKLKIISHEPLCIIRHLWFVFMYYVRWYYVSVVV